MNFSSIQKLACTLGVLVAVCIALCPHAAHKPVVEVSASVDHEFHAPEENHQDHDHGHSDFDVMHSHEFRVPLAISFQPSLLVAVIVHHEAYPCGINAERVTPQVLLPDPSPGPLQLLNSIRLLV